MHFRGAPDTPGGHAMSAASALPFFAEIKSGVQISSCTCRMSVLKRVQAELTIPSHPRFIGNARIMAERHVASLLYRFSVPLGGIPLACSNISLPADRAIVNTDFWPVHVVVKASFTVFAPAAGTRLIGQINKISADHIGMLVLGVFNASIPRNLIKPALQYDHVESKWFDEGMQTVLAAGAWLSFRVAGLTTADEVLDIKGSILDDDVGCVLLHSADDDVDMTTM